jgi:hypothetical protein
MICHYHIPGSIAEYVLGILFGVDTLGPDTEALEYFH